MLKALKQIGKEIGIDKGFKDHLLAPREGEIISILEIKNGEINVIEKIEYDDETDDKYQYCYAGGNESLVGGTWGIGGVSPFFINLSKIEKGKVERCSDFNDFYRKEYGDNRQAIAYDISDLRFINNNGTIDIFIKASSSRKDTNDLRMNKTVVCRNLCLKN